MKKVLKLFVVILSLFLIVGCKNTNSKENVNTSSKEIVEEKFKEGKYTQIAPSDKGSQGEGYKNYLTLENGKATKFDSYYEITTEGTYTVDNNILTITYTRTFGTTTYGEKYDDAYNAIYTYHIDENKIILDKMSDFDGYEVGSVIYELK